MEVTATYTKTSKPRLYSNCIPSFTFFHSLSLSLSRCYNKCSVFVNSIKVTPSCCIGCLALLVLVPLLLVLIVLFVLVVLVLVFLLSSTSSRTSDCHAWMRVHTLNSDSNNGRFSGEVIVQWSSSFFCLFENRTRGKLRQIHYQWNYEITIRFS